MSKTTAPIDQPQIDQTNSRSNRRSPWFGFSIVLFVFVVGAAFSWRKWADPLVDFGLQLYLPWKISTGSVLGRDLMYLPGGPLSVHYHALLFKLFGVSYLTIIISNLLIVAGMLLVIYRRFLAASNPLTATIIGLGIVLALAFGQYSETANYNYISPYSHDVLHGIALSILCIAFLSNWLKKGKISFACAAGFFFGLVFLTKPEVFVALGFCALAAFVIACIAEQKISFVSKSFAAFTSIALIPSLVFFLYFLQYGNAETSLHSVISPWLSLFGTDISKNPYYQWCMGLDTPSRNLRQILIHFAIFIGVVVFYAWLFRIKTDSSKNRIILFLFVAPVIALASRFDWVNCGRALPLITFVTILAICGRDRKSLAQSSSLFPLLWSLFALALLAKLGLFPRIWHYGFALAMPAFVAAIYFLLFLLPQFLAPLRVNLFLFRGVATAILLIGFIQLFVQSILVYSTRNVALEAGRDKLFADDLKINPVGSAMGIALAWVEKKIPAEATLAVLTEGAMINFLSRRSNPTPYLVWQPPEMEAFGQGKMTDTMRANPPDYVMLIHRNSDEYGRDFFGKDERFGRPVMEWVQQNYQPVYLIGKEPLQDSSFGIKILKHKAD